MNIKGGLTILQAIAPVAKTLLGKDVAVEVTDTRQERKPLAFRRRTVGTLVLVLATIIQSIWGVGIDEDMQVEVTNAVMAAVAAGMQLWATGLMVWGHIKRRK